jgi:hypothetical protein
MPASCTENGQPILRAPIQQLANPIQAQITGIRHRFIQVNGIKIHIAEQGEGPLVVLAYGWPELWYSWWHVLPALAAAGYHAVAQEMRG